MRKQETFSGWFVVGGFIFALLVGMVTRASTEHFAAQNRKEAVLAEIRARVEPSWAFRAVAERPEFSATAARPAFSAIARRS